MPQFTSSVSCAACHMSPMPTGTAKDPPPASSPTMHSRLACQDRTKIPKNNSKRKEIPKKNLPKQDRNDPSQCNSTSKQNKLLNQ